MLATKVLYICLCFGVVGLGMMIPGLVRFIKRERTYANIDKRSRFH